MVKCDNAKFRNKTIILEQNKIQLENENLNLNHQLNEFKPTL